MPFPAIPTILGASTVVGGHLTRQTILSGARSGFSQFGQALPFGAGYSLGTYLGFPKNYQTPQSSNSTTFYVNNKMPYGYYPRRRYSRYGRYSRFRRSRYSRYGRRYYRRYY